MNEITQQAIAQTLREKILAGGLSCGRWLVRARHAQWHGISRTPLRNALSVLSSERGARMGAVMNEHTCISKESLNLSLPTSHLIAGTV